PECRGKSHARNQPRARERSNGSIGEVGIITPSLRLSAHWRDPLVGGEAISPISKPLAGCR
ncbi:MAG: hypothetical protein RLN96_03540, partial [Pseudomonadales bacterium]